MRERTEASYSEQWQHNMPHYEVYIIWTKLYLWYGDKVWAQEHTLDSINPEQLSEETKKNIELCFVMFLDTQNKFDI